MRLAVVVALVLAAPAAAQAVEIAAQGVVSPVGVAGGAAVELGIGDKAGVEIRGGFLSYTYEVPDYHEEGSGPIGGVRGRYYPQDTGNATRLWLGGGVSAASVAYEWEETDQGAIVDTDEDDATLVLVEGALGYKILLGDERFVLDPQLVLGYFVAGGDTQVDVFAGAGISLGMRF